MSGYLDTFFSLSIWDHDKHTPGQTLIAGPITNVGVQVQENLTDVASYTFTVQLEDAVSGGVREGMYFELSWGNPGHQTLCVNGYLETVTRADGSPDTYSITASDALRGLMTFRNTVLAMPAHSPVYTDIVSRINGVPANDGTYPPGHRGILTGSGVTFEWFDPIHNSAPPGLGDGWTDDWPAASDALATFAQHYTFYTRRKPGRINYTKDAVIQGGPLNDDSGCHVWGGAALVDEMKASNGYTLNELDVDYSLAQGYATIVSASYQEDLSKLHNLVWPLGKGDPTKKGVSFWRLAGGPPTDQNGTPINGWTKWQPDGAGTRLYYVKTCSRTTYMGNTYEFVATQNNEGDPATAAGWAFGVVDRTSVARYGRVCEYTLTEKKISTPQWLLSAALGHLDYYAHPIPQWTLTVAHPLTSASGIPSIAAVGQKLHVHYRGQTPCTIIRDTSRGSLTYGQWVAYEQNVVYLDFPGNDDSVLQDAMQRLTNVSWTWDASNGFLVTYTLGQGPYKPHRALDDVARQMEKNQTARPVAHRFLQKQFHDLTISLSQTPLAWEDSQYDTLNLNPGATAVFDVQDETFFVGGKSVTYTVTMNDPAHYLDLWIGKPVNAQLDSPNPGDGSTYANFRLALDRSGVFTGFYSTSDGVTYTHQGTEPHRAPFSGDRTFAPGTFTVQVKRSDVRAWNGTFIGAIYEAYVTNLDYDVKDGLGGEHALVAVWHDPARGRVAHGDGTIGWKLHNGSTPAVLSNILIEGHRKTGNPSTGGDGKGGTSHVGQPGRGNVGHKITDPSTRTTQTIHLFGASGHGHHLLGVKLTAQPSTVTVSSVSQIDASTWQVNLTINSNNPLTALGAAWLLQPLDASGATIIVGDGGGIAQDKTGNITGHKNAVLSFTTHSPAAASLAAGTVLLVDHVAQSDSPSHAVTAISVAGHGKVVSITGSGGGKGIGISERDEFLVGGELWTQAYKDGLGAGTAAGGSRPTQLPGPSGISSIAPGAAGGEALARTLAQSGAVLFDAAEFSDPNASAITYLIDNLGTITSGAPITPGPTGLNAAATPSSTHQALWQSQGSGNAPTTGQEDVFLALTTAPDSTHASAVVWQSTGLTDETGAARTMVVRHDTDFAFPVWIGPAGTNILTLGSELSIVNDQPAGTQTFPVNASPLTAGVAAGQVWTLGPGTTESETLTVQSYNDAATPYPTVTFTVPATYAHKGGEVLWQDTDTSGNAVSPPMVADGTAQLGDLIPSIDAISLEMTDRAGNIWGCYWATRARTVMPQDAARNAPRTTLSTPVNVGDMQCSVASTTGLTGKAGQVIQVDRGGSYEEMIVDHLSGTTIYFQNAFAQSHASGAPVFTRLPMKHMGMLPAKSAAQWITLSAKASDLKMGQTQLAQIEIVGMSLGVYTAAGKAAQTVWFDAHSHGFAPASQSLASTITGLLKGYLPGRVLPTQNPSNIHTLDTYGWVHNGQLFWTSGALAGHNDQYYLITGGSQSNPNAGVSALLPGQTSPAGNYIVFNSRTTSLTVWDPGIGANVTIPGYSAGGGAGGQSTGFGVLSSGFDWTRRPGPDGHYTGAPSYLWRIGQIHNAANPGTTGDYQIDGEWGYTTVVALRYGAVTPAHLANSHPDRGHFTGGTFSCYRDGGGNAYLLVTPDAATGGGSFDFATDDGTSDGISAVGFELAGQFAFTPSNPTAQGVLIGPYGSSLYRSTFPATSPAGCILTFTKLFPGTITNVVPGSAGTLPNGTVYVVYVAYGKTINGIYVETPLSLGVRFTTPGALGSGSTSSVSFTPPTPPPGWSLVVYLEDGTTNIDHYQTAWTQSGSTVTLTAFNNTSASSGLGFWAFPPKSNVVTGDGTEYLMKCGHVGQILDMGTNTYALVNFQSGTVQGRNNTSAPGAITGGQTVGGVKMTDHFGGQINTTGHITTNGPAPTFSVPAGVTASASWAGDSAGLVHVTVAAGTTIPANSTLFSINLNKAHLTSAPPAAIFNWFGTQLGAIGPNTTSTNSRIDVWSGVSVGPGDYYVMYHVIGQSS